MKCLVHADQIVIMACQECVSCLVCVLCIAGSHKGHIMTTIEEAGKEAKERLKDASAANAKYIQDEKKKFELINHMEQTNNQKQKNARELMKAQGQRMNESVNKVIDHMISICDTKYKKQHKDLNDIKRWIRDSIETVQTTQGRLGQVLETDDWIQIIQEEKKTMPVPKVEDIPEDSTPDVGLEEVNKTLVTGIISTLQQCQPPSSSTEVDENTSDFQGSVYRQKSLKPVSCIPFERCRHISSIAPGEEETFWLTINNKIKLFKKQKIIKNIKNNWTIRSIAITEIDKLLLTCTEDKCVKKITSDGTLLHSFSTDPLVPSYVDVASNGDILVTLISSFDDPIPDTVGVVSRYTPDGKRMVTFERDVFGNTICPKYVAASRVSDMVVVTTHTNNDSDGWFYGHLIVMTGGLQLKFRYLGDGRVIPGDKRYNQDISTKHFSPGIDSQDNIILGDIKSGTVEIIDKHGHRLQCLGQVDGMIYSTVSIDDQFWTVNDSDRLDIFKIS